MQPIYWLFSFLKRIRLKKRQKFTFNSFKKYLNLRDINMHQFSLIPDIDFRITDFTCGIDA